MLMTKKKSGKSSRSPLRRILSAIAAIIVVIVGAIVSLFSGDQTPATPTPPPVAVTEVQPPATGDVAVVNLPLGRGAQKGFWQVFFTAPSGSRDAATYVGGIDTQLAAAINTVQRTLDIAAFEFNNLVLTQAILDAKQRGVQVRIVTDDEHGINDTADTSLAQFSSAGIPIVDDDRPGSLMHDKFMILDSTVVWTGSWNYTMNDTYRNNNSALALRSQNIVANYQAEFNEMFEQGRFGPRSPSNTPNVSFTQNGTPIQVYFASEDEVVTAIVTTLNQARRSIKFMAFSFTLSDLGVSLATKASNGVQVQGIFETTGSETRFSQLTPLFCAGLTVRQDGNPFVLHHKVFIIDDTTVIVGSFNFSAGARDSNDENLLIITDRDLAAQYTAEFDRRWAESKLPDPNKLNCS
jgi:phosphatidylserine/phosphatidylglycerophosphate/cardiolipin synthase-like enzyme